MIVIENEDQFIRLVKRAVKESITEALMAENIKTQPEESDKFLTVPEAALFLRLSIPTIYGLIHRKELPSMRRSKRVYFSKLDLINYLKAGKRKTAEELDHEAEEFLKERNKNG